jgi:hypothetical protein
MSMGSLDAGSGATAAAAPSPPGGWRGAIASMRRFVAPMGGYVAPALVVGAIGGAFVLGAWIIGERIGEGVEILKEGLDNIHRGTQDHSPRRLRLRCRCSQVCCCRKGIQGD